MHRALALLVFLAAIAGPGRAALAQSADELRHYELPNFDALELTLPAGWRDAYDPPGEGSLPLIQLSDAAASAFSVEILAEWSHSVADPVPDAETLREAVRLSSERVRAQSLEPSFEIRRLQGTSGVGFYFRATASEPQAGEFRCMTQGALQVGPLTLWFTILTPDARDPAIERALTMLGAASYRGAGLDER